MPNTPKLAIKVGITSTLRLRGVRAYRAITAHELSKLIEKDPEIKLVIIEKVYENEYNETCEIIRNFLNRKDGQKVMFYSPDNDAITTGAADVLELDIYLTAKDLYRSIKGNCGILVDPDLSLWVDSANDEDDFGVEFDTSLDDALTAAKDAIEEDITDGNKVNAPVITGKDDLEDGKFTTYDIGLSSSNTEILGEPIPVKDEPKPQEPKPQEPEKPHKDPVIHNKKTEATVVLPSVNLPTASDAVDTVKNIATTAAIGAEVAVIAGLKAEIATIKEENTTLKKKYLDALEKVKGLNLEASKANAERAKLSARINELESNASQSNASKSEQEKALQLANAEKANLQNQLAEQGQKIDDLESQLEASKDEMASLKIESIALQNRLTDLQQLKDTLEEETNKVKSDLEGSISELNSKVSDYQSELDTKSDEISSLLENRNNLTSLVETLQSEKQTLEMRIDSLTSELNDPERDAKHQEELSELSNQIDELNARLDELNGELSKTLEELQTSKERAQEWEDRAEGLIRSYRRFMGALSDSIFTIVSLESNIADLTDQVNFGLSSISNLETNNLSLSAELDTVKLELTQAIADADKRVELAKAYTAEEMARYKKDAATYKTQLDYVKSQLEAKEVQYNTLVQTTGFDESGANALMEHNKTLEVMNTNLMKQLADTKRELDKTEKSRLEQAGIVARLKDQNHQLSVSLRAMTSTVTGGANTVIPPVGYTGKGFVIPVIGSGSFGITTTAMSMAMSLAAQSRVIYIDFDMVSAKADSWFKINPIVKNIPGIEGLGAKASGLGLFIEKGSQFFYDYVSSIVNRSIKTKGGCIDYLSGIYTKPDTVKLVSADFTGLFNYCGGNYDYVIIDFGRIGCSDINDQIIQLISEVAHRTVVVTPNDKLDIRNTRFALNKAKINVQNIAWLINLSESTKLDELSKNSISPAKNVIIPFMPDFYGQKRDFTKEKPSRDKFNVFLNDCVIHR